MYKNYHSEIYFELRKGRMHKIIYYVVSHKLFRKLLTTSYSYAQYVYDDQLSRKALPKKRLLRSTRMSVTRNIYVNLQGVPKVTSYF